MRKIPEAGDGKPGIKYWLALRTSNLGAPVSQVKWFRMREAEQWIVILMVSWVASRTGYCIGL